jgi:hypothetical protein
MRLTGIYFGPAQILISVGGRRAPILPLAPCPLIG